MFALTPHTREVMGSSPLVSTNNLIGKNGKEILSLSHFYRIAIPYCECNIFEYKVCVPLPNRIIVEP